MQALSLLRALRLQRHASRGMLSSSTLSSTVSPSSDAASTARHNISFERYGAMPSCQMCSPTAVLASAGAMGKQHQQA